MKRDIQMNITLKKTATIILTVMMAATMASCSKFGKSSGQSIEFATFIKAHTGGIISDKSTIRVELASSIQDATPGADLKEGVLTFSPSMKGTSRWLSSSMIEFIPENGQLKPGQAYTGKLRLDKIQKVGSRKFRKFNFHFLVAIKEAVLQVSNVTITAASPDVASIDGTISLTEELPLERVQKMIAYDYPESTSEISVAQGSDPLSFRFEIMGLARSDRDQTLKIRLRSGDTGFVADSRTEVTIPAKGSFKVTKAELNEADDPYILVSFSEPIDPSVDMTGLFRLEGVDRSYLQIEDSNVRIFFEDAGESTIFLTVSDAVRSYDGARLAGDFTKEFTFTEDKPAVVIPVTGNILPDSRQLLLPFKAVNLRAVDIRVIQIYEENVLMFLQDNDLDGSNSLRRAGRLICKRCLRLDSDPSRNLHKWQDFSIDLSGLFKQEPGAIYRILISFKQDYSLYGKEEAFRSGRPSDKLMEIASEDITIEDDREWDKPYPYYYDNFYDWEQFRWEDRENPMKPTYYMDESRFPVINLLTSNLGVIAKYSGGDKLWVSVSDILTAAPVFNAELYVYSYQLKEIGYAKSGTDGMAEIQLTGKPFAVVTKRGGATSYLKVTEGNEKTLSRFDVGGKALDQGLKAFIYGERGVWRPADTLHVTMILEDKEDRIPDSHPVSMELYTPTGQFYTKLINSNGKDGFYVFDIPTKAEDPTGTWHAIFKVGGATFNKSLKIESIKPNRLKVNLDLDGEVIRGGERNTLEINSSWLTGPPASNLRSTVRMTLRRGSTTFKGLEGYDFTSPMSEYSSSEHDLADVRLDAYGKAKVSVEMPSAEDAPGMLSADIVTSVMEEGGDISFSTMTVPYSPYSSYVGISVPSSGRDGYLETDKDYNLKVATVDKDGRRVSGVHLEYSIYKLRWSWWWESRSESLDSYVNGSAAEALTSGTIVSGKGDSSIPFRIDYPEWGRYLVMVKDMDSGHICGQIMYVDWPASRGKSSKADPDALTMLSFSTDKDSYDVGETATVYIPAASKGQALVSLENSRTVISREWVKMNGESDVAYSFKITPEMAPNFYIHISLVQPHERVDNDLPVRLYGVRPVLVNDKESHLEPVITMPDVLRPETDFTVKVKERNGKPMTYTLAIVDEGLLDLTGFKTPDPWKAMHEREALGVRTWDLYDDVIGAYSGRFSPMFSIGGDENLIIGSKKDNRFNPVVKFIGPYTLTSGTASHKLKLPMYVGSVRVMVIAAKDATYGCEEKTVPVKSPLMVLPTLPRTISEGEKVTMPVNVFALENDVRDAKVSIKVDGPLAITGDDKCQVHFDKPGDSVVRFALEATGKGTATITVNAEGNGNKAYDRIVVDVEAPNPAVTSVSKAMVAKGERKHFGFSPFKQGEEDWAELEISRCPSFDANGVYSFMTAYPYGCTEQLAAQGITLLSIADMLPEKKKEQVQKMIPSIIQQVCQRQRPDGGFALWPESSDTQSWVSSMVGQFMLMASQEGFSVSKGVLASWSRYQKKLVQDYRNADSRFLWDLEQAYRLYTLALGGEAESGAMNRLKESQTLSPQAGWMLASTYSLTGKKAVAQEMISALKSDFTVYQDKDRTFGSPLRDKAMALASLVLADDITEAMSVAGEVSHSLTSGAYTTQEAAFSTCAMKSLASRIGDGNISAQVTYGSEAKSVESTKAAVRMGIDPESGGVYIENTSENILYTQLTVSNVPAGNRKVEARSNGLGIKVVYTANNGKVIDPSEIAQGTEFTATITVSNTSAVKDYDNLALMQKIPSGWEIVNDRIGSDHTSLDSRDIRDDRNIWHFSLPKGTGRTFKVRLHAAYEGEFVLPAVRCEAMYDPHICANTASGTARVTR